MNMNEGECWRGAASPSSCSCLISGGGMAERRYNFRFSLPEGFVIFLSLLLTSFLIFLFGVHVGKETQARKVVQQGRTVRLPVSLSESGSAPVSQLPSDVLGTKNLGLSSGKDKTAASSPASEVSVAPPKPASESSVASRLQQSQQRPDLNRPQTSSPPVNPAKTGTGTNPTLSPSSKQTVTAPIGKPQAQLSTKRHWSVQVHATQRQSAAQDIVKRLREQGYIPVVNKITRQGETWYRVRVGNFVDEEQARETIARFRREGTFPQAYLVSD
jgi:cell division septation protein DedD